jgi:UDP:flavonoid glycosyltransferase YjiC (YdhE family)
MPPDREGPPGSTAMKSCWRAWLNPRAGAGPAPIPFPALTAERLAAAIHQAVTDQHMRHRAAELGTRIRAEDGPGRTAELFSQIARTAGKRAEP